MKRRLDNLTIKKEQSIIEALRIINDSSKGIVYVIDDDNKLKGTITDGDIRRALIDGIELKDSIEKVINNNPIKANINTDIRKLKEIMIKKAIREIPLVNDENIIVDSVCLNDLLIPKGKDNKVIIMAGGLGTRLKELTVDIPKPMLNLGDRPILHHIIEKFKSNGFNKFLLSVNYKSEIIENYFEDGSRYECKINYLREKKRLGTAGAISLAKSYIDDDFFVMNGDIYSTVDFDKVMRFHKKNNNDITIVTVRKTVNIPYGVLNIDNDNRVTTIIEKPNYEYLVSGGIYCLSPKVLDLIPEDEYFEITELFDKVIKKEMSIRSYVIDDYWIDIGRLEDYNRINKEIIEMNHSKVDGEYNDRK